MGRRRAELAEIVGRAHDALAEMVLPDAVNQHARREWMVGPGKPAGQLQPAAAVVDRFLSGAGEHLGEMPRDYRAEPGKVTADVQRHILDAGKHAPRHTA